MTDTRDQNRDQSVLRWDGRALVENVGEILFPFPSPSPPLLRMLCNGHWSVNITRTKTTQNYYK